MERLILRFPLRASGLLAAAAVAGAIVYWRANDRRSRQLEAAIDDGIADGRQAAGELLQTADEDSQPFDHRS
jgi:hypothetical protein